MHFENLWALLLLPLVFLPFWLKGRQGQLYSWLAIAPQDRFSDIANLLLKIITSLLILCLVLAMAAPRGADQEIQKSGKGAQIVMAIDRSVSMEHRYAADTTSAKIAEIKSAAARRVITTIIESRPDDMMGVVGFTNSPLYGSKITTNRAAILAAINAATSTGLNQTNIGAGLTQATSLFDKIENSGSRAIILLSDGAGKLSPRIKKEIREETKKRDLSLYWIVIREPDDISIFSKADQFSEGMVPASVELHQYFKDLKINYNAYEADNPTALQSAIQDIGSKENKKIRYTITVPGHDYSFELLIAAMILGISLLVAKNLRVYSWQAA